MAARAPLVLLVVLAAVPARATVLHDWSLEERIANADHVVVGKITAQKAGRDGETIITESTIAVSETLYGPKVEALTVTQLGGTLNGETLQVPGAARIEVGDEVVLIVKAVNGRNRLVGMSLGAFTLRGRLARQTIDVPVMRRDGVLRGPLGEQVVDVERIRRAASDVQRTLQRTRR